MALVPLGGGALQDFLPANTVFNLIRGAASALRESRKRTREWDNLASEHRRRFSPSTESTPAQPNYVMARAFRTRRRSRRRYRRRSRRTRRTRGARVKKGGNLVKMRLPKVRKRTAFATPLVNKFRRIDDIIRIRYPPRLFCWLSYVHSSLSFAMSAGAATYPISANGLKPPDSVFPTQYPYGYPDIADAAGAGTPGKYQFYLTHGCRAKFVIYSDTRSSSVSDVSAEPLVIVLYFSSAGRPGPSFGSLDDVTNYARANPGRIIYCIWRRESQRTKVCKMPYLAMYNAFGIQKSDWLAHTNFYGAIATNNPATQATINFQIISNDTSTFNVRCRLQVDYYVEFSGMVNIIT